MKKSLLRQSSIPDFVTRPERDVPLYCPVTAVQPLFESDNVTAHQREAYLRYLLHYQHYNADFTLSESGRLGYPNAVCAPQEYPGYWRTEYKRQIEILSPWVNYYLKDFSKSFSGCKKACAEHYYVGTSAVLEIMQQFYAEQRLVSLDTFQQDADQQQVIVVEANPFELKSQSVITLIQQRLGPRALKEFKDNFFLFVLRLPGIECQLFSVGELTYTKTGKPQMRFMSLDQLFDEHIYSRCHQCAATPDRIALNHWMTVGLGAPGVSFALATQIIGARVANVVPSELIVWHIAITAFSEVVFEDAGRELLRLIILRWQEVFFSQHPEALEFAKSLLVTQVAPWLSSNASVHQLAKAYQNLCEIVMCCLDAFDAISQEINFSDALLSQLPLDEFDGQLSVQAALYPYGMAPIFDQLMQLFTRPEFQAKVPNIACLNRNYFETSHLTSMLSGQHAEVTSVSRLGKLQHIPDIVITEIHPNNAASENQFQNDVGGWVTQRLGQDADAKLVLILDVTLNHLAEDRFQALVKQLQPFLENGQLEIFCTQSLAKLIQFGSDNFSGGSCIYMGSRPELVTFPAANAAKSAYYGMLLTHFDELLPRYYDIVRRNSSWMYQHLQSHLEDLSESIWIKAVCDGKPCNLRYSAMQVSVNVDEGAVYVALNFQNLFVQIDPLLQKLILVEQQKEQKLRQKLKKQEEGLKKSGRSVHDLALQKKLLKQQKRQLRTDEKIVEEVKESLVKQLRVLVMTMAAKRGLHITARQSFGFSLSNMSQALFAIRFSIGIEDQSLLQQFTHVIGDFNYALSMVVADNPAAFSFDAFSKAILATYEMMAQGEGRRCLTSLSLFADVGERDPIGTVNLYYHQNQFHARGQQRDSELGGNRSFELSQQQLGFWMGNIDAHPRVWRWSDQFYLLFHLHAFVDKPLYLCQQAIGGHLEGRSLFTNNAEHADTETKIKFRFEPSFLLTDSEGHTYQSYQVFVRCQDLVEQVGSVEPRLNKLPSRLQALVFTSCVRNHVQLLDHPEHVDCKILEIGELKKNYNYEQEVNTLIEQRKFEAIVHWLNSLDMQSLPLCHNQGWHELSERPIVALCRALNFAGVILSKNLNNAQYQSLLTVKNKQCRRAIMQGVFKGLQHCSQDGQTQLTAKTIRLLSQLFKLEDFQSIFDMYEFDDWIVNLADHLEQHPDDIARVNGCLAAGMGIIQDVFSHPMRLRGIRSAHELLQIAMMPGCLGQLNRHVLLLVDGLPAYAATITNPKQVAPVLELMMTFPLPANIKNEICDAISGLPNELLCAWLRHPGFYYYPLEQVFVQEYATDDDFVIGQKQARALAYFVERAGLKPLLMQRLASRTITASLFKHVLLWAVYTDDPDLYSQLFQVFESVVFPAGFAKNNATLIGCVSHPGLFAPLHEMLYLETDIKFLRLQQKITDYCLGARRVQHGAFVGQLPRDWRELSRLLNDLCRREVPISEGLARLCRRAESLGANHPILRLARQCYRGWCHDIQNIHQAPNL